MLFKFFFITSLNYCVGEVTALCFIANFYTHLQFATVGGSNDVPFLRCNGDIFNFHMSNLASVNAV